MQDLITDRSAEAPITLLLKRWKSGDAAARNELFTVVYQQVHQIAQGALRAKSGATINPTELSNEALIRLLGSDATYENRRHFFGVVATATRQVLIDGARKRMAQKRGSLAGHISLEQASQQDIERPGLESDADAQLLRLEDALTGLAQAYPRQSQLIELLYFGGFTQTDLAQTMELSISTVERDLRFAKAWLKQAVLT